MDNYCFEIGLNADDGRNEFTITEFAEIPIEWLEMQTEEEKKEEKRKLEAEFERQEADMNDDFWTGR